jgi:hypothetical protein
MAILTPLMENIALIEFNDYKAASLIIIG